MGDFVTIGVGLGSYRGGVGFMLLRIVDDGRGEVR